MIKIIRLIYLEFKIANMFMDYLENVIFQCSSFVQKLFENLVFVGSNWPVRIQILAAKGLAARNL